MRAGKLRQVVTYQEPVPVRSSYGQVQSPTWSTIFTARAEVRTLTGREALVAAQLKTTVDKVVTLRTRASPRRPSSRPARSSTPTPA